MLDEGTFKNNEHIDVYFIELKQRMPADRFVLQASEVRAARYMLQLAFRLFTLLSHSKSHTIEQVSEVRWIHARELLDAWDRGESTFVGNSGDTEVSFYCNGFHSRVMHLVAGGVVG